MKMKSKSQLFKIVVEYEKGMTRTVPVKAATRRVAEERALKRNPTAKGIKRG